MKKYSGWRRLLPVLTFLSVLLAAGTAYGAETKGGLTGVYSDRITGWAWNVGAYDETLDVELQIYKDGAKQPAETATVSANSYSSEVSQAIGDGYHAFDYLVDWAKLGGSTYKVEAYAISGEKKSLLPDPIQIKASDLKLSPGKLSPFHEQELLDSKTGPGAKEAAAASKSGSQNASTDSTGTYKKGASLGMFTTTGYCTCSKCTGGSGLTYSGTVPKAKHTISADLSVLPLGTKVMIGDIVYTVEDIGSGVDGKWIDIYYDVHEQAEAHGMKTQEVFAVIAQ